MTLLAQIARPLSWLTKTKPLRTQPDTALAVTGAAANKTPVTGLAMTVPAGKVQCVGNRVTLPRCLDASCYQELLIAAQQVYTSGKPELVVDLHDVEQIELTGLFALHCIVLTMRGKTPPDPEQGWHALRALADENLAAGRAEQVKLVNPSVRITAWLQANHLDRCLLIAQRAEFG